ncbi:RimK family alpha-L-glutamate ligase [Nonomuraea sp. NPDC059194]|uniref:ATP-grasp domain-containing protein n=1 Tax=Nonomuraea sp. NPDC059194 TaxID=3346764 RepID=UPI0036935185
MTFADAEARDDERDLVIAAWQEAGIEGRVVRWDDPETDWSAFDAAVVRSVWDYVGRREEFLAWARATAGVTRLLNPAAVLAANTDKTYLRELGVPTVPTHWSADGMPHWAEYVVKPAISAGALDTIRTTDRQVALAHAQALEAAGRTPMVQPYLDMVEAEGETSLLYFNRTFSHAVRRNAMLAGGQTIADNARADLRQPADDQIELAEKVLAAVQGELLYARVDMIRLADGTPALMELELTEPYLFLNYAEGAAGRLTKALTELL